MNGLFDTALLNTKHESCRFIKVPCFTVFQAVSSVWGFSPDQLSKDIHHGCGQNLSITVASTESPSANLGFPFLQPRDEVEIGNLPDQRGQSPWRTNTRTTNQAQVAMNNGRCR